MVRLKKHDEIILSKRNNTTVIENAMISTNTCVSKNGYQLVIIYIQGCHYFLEAKN